MSFEVRTARPEDVERIVPWTAGTFEWGDYVPDRLPRWIEDTDSKVIVCVDGSDKPVAVAHAIMLSTTEGWLEAARVHPDHKRSGMGSAMNRAGVAWCRERGARVVRLATEEDNEAARRQVESLGYRCVSNWVYAEFDVAGVRPIREVMRLKPAPSSDVDPAWMFWSTSDLAHKGRSLIANGWQWRKARTSDLVEAASRGEFYQCPAGWAIADSPVTEALRLVWLATTIDEAPRIVEALIDLAAEQGYVELNVKAPNLPWMAETLSRAGAEPRKILVYALAV